MFLVHTDFGHDPDDAIALAYLIEHRLIPNIIGITPGHFQQEVAMTGFLNCYDETSYFADIKLYKSNIVEYNPSFNIGKHYIFNSGRKYLFFPPYDMKVDKALIIGPAKNIGNRLECEELYFQGGYSPNSIKPLEKFRGLDAVQSFNPNGAIADFLLLRDSTKIKRKYYIGKNVCHGFTKRDLVKIWQPKNPTICKFFDELKDDKAMHDVLAAILFMNKDLGIWSQEKPVRIAGKYTTEPTNEEIYSLIGLNL
jgi:hypothetical protein